MGSVDVVVDKLRVDRSRVRLAEVMVGDESGCAYLRARDNQIDILKEISDRKGAVVLRNTTIEVFQGRFLRLAITKWGKISSFPDQVASTPSPPKAINESLNYSAVNLSLIVKEISVPSSPEGGEDDDSPSSTSHQKLSMGESSRYRKPSFDDSRSSRSYTSGASRSKGRRGPRKQNQQYQYHRTHGGKSGVVHPQGSPTSQPYPAQYPGVYAAIPIQDMSSFPTAMYSHTASQGGSPELPQYAYPAQKAGQGLTAHEAEHHRKHQALIAQQYELQQRHHYQQMQLFQQQQENHQRLLQAQQQQFSSPRLSSGTRKGRCNIDAALLFASKCLSPDGGVADPDHANVRTRCTSSCYTGFASHMARCSRSDASYVADESSRKNVCTYTRPDPIASDSLRDVRSFTATPRPWNIIDHGSRCSCVRFSIE